MIDSRQRNWPSARHFTEAIQCPSICFSEPLLMRTLPAVDRLGMPLVTSGQFAYVYKLNGDGSGNLAVRCFRGYLKDRDQRYRAIQHHLRNQSLPFLSDVTYEPEGILVEGQRFPILFMKWIEGPTLDLYLDQMIGRPDVMLHLGQEWIRMVAALHDAGLAHGDLQHGNIIVERGRLRLVDHDGIFTPEMAGWNSSELGHQHYQHPRRDEILFNAQLDNFSALVIYLSLISLAERPALWSRYHDENLLFTKADFIDPDKSSLFAEIETLGPEHSRLAEILKQAIRSEPTDVPFLGDLVSLTSRLPTWMTAPLAMEPKPKTREVVPPDVSNGNAARWKPWKPRASKSRLPSTTPSSTYQTIFSGPGKADPPDAVTATPMPAATAAQASILFGATTKVPAARDPDDVLMNTGYFAKEFLRQTFIWWYWGIYLCLQFMGMDTAYALILAVVCLLLGSLAYGFVRALDLSHNAPASLPGIHPQGSIASVPPQLNTSVVPKSITTSEAVIGNSKLNIYHVNTCNWVERISPRNRVGFSSPAAAVADGYKPCHVCSIHLNGRG